MAVCSDVWYAAQHHRQFNYAFWMDVSLFKSCSLQHVHVQVVFSHTPSHTSLPTLHTDPFSLPPPAYGIAV